MGRQATFGARLKLRRGSAQDYGEEFVPLEGELCLVDTEDGVKAKVGDGVTAFPYLDFILISIIFGYYYNGEFYYDPYHQAKAGAYKDKLYLDRTYNQIYTYDGEQYRLILSIPLATETHPGAMKLYKQTGYNEDGTMTQKAITENIPYQYVDQDTLIVFNTII